MAHHSAESAIHERMRYANGLRSSRDLPPEAFDATLAELKALKELAEQHRDRMVTLDREFIEAVLRPPVSIKKVRAMARRQASQPPLAI